MFNWVVEKIKSKRQLVIAHRGASGSAPENTLAAFRRAKEFGVDGIELDVHLSASGEIVVIHDYELNRTATNADGTPLNSTLTVEDLTLSQLQAYDVGQGEKIPTLQQVMDLIGPEIMLDIEIKANQGKPYKELSVALAGFLAQYGKDKSIDNVFVSSFNPLALNVFRKEAHKLKIDVPTALIYANTKDVFPILRYGHGRFIHNPDILKPRYLDVENKKDLEQLKGKPIVAWTVNDETAAGKLLEKGIGGIISNYPEKMLKLKRGR